jgi:hypothetical protein
MRKLNWRGGWNRRMRLIALSACAALLAACGETVSTQVVVVISPTPNPTEIAFSTQAAAMMQTLTAEATPEIVTEIPPTVAASATVQPAQPTAQTVTDTVITEEVTNDLGVPTAVITSQPAVQEASPAQAATAAIPLNATVAPTQAPPTSTPLPPNFPTPVQTQIRVAEQLFENGRMFWLEPTDQIWVMVVTDEGRGTWTIYPDTFIDGEQEFDPSLTAPEGLLQPERGFGKLWRSVPAVREALGWAVTPEFGYTSPYEYQAGGTVDAAGTYTRSSGEHFLYSLYGERFRFNEGDGTWQLG